VPFHAGRDCLDQREIALNEERLIELETRIAYQEETLRTLDESVARQQLELIRLEQRMDALQARLAAMVEATPREAPVDERPPHY
jgi:SlyX protein